MFKKFDYLGGRTFVVGDIHGEFGLLEDTLYKLDFDRSIDHLFSVGDLVDRGPASHVAIEYLEFPWFHAIRGNHEQMTIDAGGSSWHVGNGGAWFNELNHYEREAVIEAFQKLPLIIEFTTPTGRKIGIAHASFPPTGNNRSEFECDWNDAERIANTLPDPHTDHEVLWDRWQIGRAKKISVTGEKGQKFAGEFNIKNIDHVYFGHTPMKDPLHVGNCSWIDTGAFATKNLTVIEVE